MNAGERIAGVMSAVGERGTPVGRLAWLLEHR